MGHQHLYLSTARVGFIQLVVICKDFAMKSENGRSSSNWHSVKLTVEQNGGGRLTSGGMPHTQLTYKHSHPFTQHGMYLVIRAELRCHAEINELTLYQITLEDQQFYRYAHAFAVKAVSLVRVDRDTFMNNYTQHQ